MACFTIAFVMTVQVTLVHSQSISIRPIGGEVFWEGGGPIELKCIVLEDRFSNIYWIRDNSTVWSLNDEILVDLSPNHKVSHGINRLGRAWADLHIETAQRKHSGFYTCLAEDPITHEHVDTHQYIRVKYVPHQKYPLCLVEEERNSQRLNCITEPGSPRVMLKWFSSAVNSTELSSVYGMEEGLLTQKVDFGNLYPPEGELLTSDTNFICKMYVEDYGALHSCSFGAETIYRLNSSFDILPLDLSVVFGEPFVATCVSPLPLATFVVTLYVPDRPPRQPRTTPIDNGVAVVLYNVNFDYNGAIFSCEMRWGPFYGRTKISRIAVIPFREPNTTQEEHNTSNPPTFGGKANNQMGTLPTLESSENEDVKMEQNKSKQVAKTLLDSRPSPTLDGESVSVPHNTNGHPVPSNRSKESVAQFPGNDYDKYPSPSLSEKESAVQNGTWRGPAAAAPTAPIEPDGRVTSPSQGASNSVTFLKQQDENNLRDSVAEDVWPSNMTSETLHGDGIHDLRTKDQDKEIKTTFESEVTNLNETQQVYYTSQDASSNDGSNVNMEGHKNMFSGTEASSPVDNDTLEGSIESFKMVTMTQWANEKTADEDAISDSSYGMPKRPDFPMENGTHFKAENINGILTTVFILISFMLFMVLLFLLGLLIRVCHQKRQQNNVKTVVD